MLVITAVFNITLSTIKGFSDYKTFRLTVTKKCLLKPNVVNFIFKYCMT